VRRSCPADRRRRRPALGRFFSPEHLIALLTLRLLEIVLGIDNVVFISIPADRLLKN
jgi:predicted tellurium resistance membrane protein TerC